MITTTIAASTTSTWRSNEGSTTLATIVPKLARFPLQAVARAITVTTPPQP
jgi:hypothetical protein